LNLATRGSRLQSAQELQWGDFTAVPRGMRHSPETLAPEIIEVVFNLRQFGMVQETSKRRAAPVKDRRTEANDAYR